jgi:glycosyltransferase involved in cell wall biosynthesis
MGAPDLSVVVPVYNEGDNITPTLTRLLAAVHAELEILVVYDFDEDTTVPVVRGLAGSMPQVRLHRNTLGRGALNAIRSGMDAAAAPYVLVTMADGCDDPAAIDAMLALARDGADLVAASRYMPGGRQVGGPLLKRTLSRLAGLSLCRVGGLPVRDPTNNFKLYSRRLLQELDIRSEAGFELGLELTVRAHLAGLRLAEVPTTWHDRTAGESRFRLLAWLPHYLRWYRLGITGRLARRPVYLGRPAGPPAGTSR